MNLWQIIIGLATTIFLIFLKEAHSKAQKQKIVATRLESYLHYWKSVILEHNLFNFFYMGIKWNEEIDELIKNGGKTIDIVELEKNKKHEIDELKKDLQSKPEFKLSISDIEKALSKLPSNSIDYILKHVSTSEQNLIEGKTFITDQEASYLGRYIAQVSITLKMELISIMNSLSGLAIITLSSKEDIDFKEHIDDILKLVWKGVVISKHIDTLSKQVGLFTKKSIISLTFNNLKDKL